MPPVPRRPRVLLAVLVYNGRDFVPACLASASGLRSGARDVDVLVLDDCSPDEDWSRELAELCASMGVGYYRSPRNLGIPRNMNLALLRAVTGGYDSVVLVNSDVVLPLNLLDVMLGVVDGEPGVGSVTAWSNNVSVFSLPNADETGSLSRPDVVDWVSQQLQDQFSTSALDLPTGVGFCLLLPVPVVAEVGLLDPVYGRGYCEEVDWCLRSRARGYRAVLAPGTFVFHHGGRSTADAGLVTGQARTVAEHERIVDLRYPDYRRDVAAFLEADDLAPLRAKALWAVVVGGGQRWGYHVETRGLPGPPSDPALAELARVVVDPDRPGEVTADYRGFRQPLHVDGDDLAGFLRSVFGGPPRRVSVYDRGGLPGGWAADFGLDVPFVDRSGYPERV
ncbi:MAG TPA: glycosyltransferase family 2 protein [Acidimicrobiales bacterium]|nr:glycosyltransferase family 2 protein [Acidimicrobiales bacterium]